MISCIAKNFLVFLAGFAFIIGGTVMCVKVFDYSDKQETTAVITEFESYKEKTEDGWETKRKTHLEYEIDGKKYESIITGYSSTWDIGEAIPIYYDVNNHLNVGVKRMDFMLLMLPAFGLFCLSIGVIKTVKEYKNAKSLEGNITADELTVEGR